MLKAKVLAVLVAVMLLSAGQAWADVFTGTLFYTDFTGGQNVNKVSYSYDSTTHALTLGAPTNIASANGADGIIFAPNGDLLVGGQGNPVVHEYTPTGTFVADGSANTASFHLALDPSGTKVYTSNFGGPLEVLPFGPAIGNATQHTVTGGDTGLTQIAFGQNGKVFYVNGQPNGSGNVGFIDLTTFTTTRLYTTLGPAHGIIYDAFANKITLFGAGGVATIDPTTGLGLKTRLGINADFDQGAVDAFGHAFIAGNGQITFIDYSATGDITDPTNFTKIVNGFSGIDDLAPLSGLGSSPVFEPATFLLLGSGLVGLGALRFRRRAVR